MEKWKNCLLINKLLKRRNVCVQCVREESLLGLPHREHSALMNQGRPQAGALLPLGAEEGGGQGTVPSWSRKRAGPKRGLLASSQRGRWSYFWSWKDDREVASAEPSGGLSQEWDKVPPLSSRPLWTAGAGHPPQRARSAGGGIIHRHGAGRAIWRSTHTRDSLTPGVLVCYAFICTHMCSECFCSFSHVFDAVLTHGVQ